MIVHTDKKLDELSLSAAADSEETDQEKSLRWLLDMDLSEPEEKLFTVADDDYLDTGLSAFETEVAGRPLVRGNASSDDLESYVDEEIVFSAAGAGVDIYSRKETLAAAEPTRSVRDEFMAVDYSRKREDAGANFYAHVEEGADILGLAGDDDIGEKFMSIQRVKPVLKGGVDRSVAPATSNIAVSTTDAAASEGNLASAADYTNVSDYVATIPQSMDDEEFDSYLLAGEHLPDGFSNPEDLVIQRDEGVISVDPSSDILIDYHEDFRAMGDFERGSLTANEATQHAQPTDWALDDGFGEDIFGENFAEGLSALAPHDDGLFAPDIDAVFADFFPFEDGRDEICGVGFDAFETAAVDESTVESLQGQHEEAYFAQQEASLTPVDREPDPVEEPDLAAFDGTCLDGFVPDHITFSYSTQSNAEIFTDFLDAFIEEGSEEVEKLENEVGEWERNVSSEPLFGKVSRTLHTLKGIAKGVGLQRLGTLVHNFETLLEKMPRPSNGQQQTYFRIVNAWLDAIVRGVEYVVDKRADVASEFPAPRVEAMSQQQAEPIAHSDAEDPARRQVETKILTGELKSTGLSALEKKRDQQLADEGAKVLAAQQSVRITSEKLDHLLNLTSQAQQLGVRASQNTTRSKRSSAELQARLSSVRTHIRKIADRALLDVNARPGSSSSDMDALEMDQYSELQEAASILREGVEDLADLVDVVSRQNMQIETLLKQQSSVISSISSSIQGARVVPVSRLMPGLRRIVRTVSADLGKIVSFKTLNETGALDRDHYGRLQVILEHMVRNALDHGIELPDERMAMGKPTGGRITIDVRKSGADYLVRLADDGRGIDPDAIRETAYEKGLDVDVDALSDEEAIRLIFHKGFSTASTLSEISGRGVGMDIVLTELQQIGGDVQIQSTIGLGTVFDIRIPSNVSVNGALLVRSAGESYAIPLNGLVAVEQVPVDEFFAAVEESTPLSVADLQCDATYLATLCQGVGLPDRGIWGKYVPVIVAGTADRFMAIAIDSLEEALELVVRSLGSQFSTVPGLAGAATTAEGEAIIALDLNLLVSTAGADGIAPVAVSKSKSTTLLALVVDDSRTQRMVATSQLDAVGVETVTAENGLVAIDLLNAAHRLPDIVLLDVEMPVKDGIQTLREIRKSRRYGHLPVIMVTSRTGAKHRALAGEAGCNGYMGKPFNFPELIRQINELTGHDLQLS
jgi:chemotaxis protein histidine kinase CheA